MDLARQVGRQRAGGRFGRSRPGRLQPHRPFGRADLQLLQVQFELAEEVVRALRAPAKLLAAQLGDPQLEMGDFRLLAGDHRF